MDQHDARGRLDGLIEPNGALVLFNDAHPEIPENL
jgi:hypothetical protein